MSKERNVCLHCGAKQKISAQVCDLCGSSLSGELVEAEADGAEFVDEVASLSAIEEIEELEQHDQESSSDTIERGGFCTSCGASYPVGSRFCGSCGRKIAMTEATGDATTPAKSAVPVSKSIPTPETPPAKRAATDKELGRQVLLVVGAAVILIVALFVITVVSRDQGGSVPPQSGQSASPLVLGPLPAEVQGTVQSLRDQIDALTGEAKTLKRRELADFLISHGRWDLAGEVQEEIAAVTGAESDWVRTGNLYYDWMEGVGDESKAGFAQRAISAYQQALQINPDNLDVRTDMAIAYMFDPENSVQAIAQTNMVLEQDSLHVQANFNRGIMLLRINRFEEAISQFNTVKRVVGDPANPIYQRAESALDALRQVNP